MNKSIAKLLARVRDGKHIDRYYGVSLDRAIAAGYIVQNPLSLCYTLTHSGETAMGEWWNVKAARGPK